MGNAYKFDDIEGGVEQQRHSLNGGVPTENGYTVTTDKVTTGVTVEGLLQQEFPVEHEEAKDPRNYTPHVTYSAKGNGAGLYTINIISEIGVPALFADVIDALHVAREEDEVVINIASPGGYIFCAVMICLAIFSCRAHVTTRAVGMCASCGSLIWICGDDKEVEPYASIMFHMSLQGGFNDSVTLSEKCAASVGWIKSIMTDLALKPGYVTEDEFTRFTEKRENIWISGEVMQERLVRRNTDEEG